ncbi:MAG: hypothetical protein J0M07_14880 [Anaerolineae bacterium]|nr:hypothetical protein [Anaerolineae bacterium]
MDDSINLIPVFIAEVDSDDVKISYEHSAFEWLSFEDAFGRIHWENQTEDSVWGRGSIPGGSGFWYTATATDAERLYLYIEGGRSGGTDIYLATADLEALMP